MTVVPITAPTSWRGSQWGSEWGGVWGDLIEYVPDLTFPFSVWVYSKMELDPQLRGIMSGYTLPIRRADWRVDPAGCRPEVAAWVADNMGLPLLGADPEPQAARRRGFVWDKHLPLALRHLVFGFYPFEKRFELVDGNYRLAEVAERVPASIVAMKVAKTTGELVSITQDTTRAQPIPADRLLWYVNEKEGANWTGRSMLRFAYGAWLLKHETWRVHATSIRRFGMGIPEVEAPPGATPQQVAEAQRLASAMRAGETAGIGLPNGFRSRLAGMVGSVPDALGFIRYLDQQMSTGALAGLLDLGSTPNGSRALGEVFMDLLVYAVQSSGDAVGDEATRSLSIPLVDYRWGEDEPAPRIVCGDVAGDREVTLEGLKLMLDAGALTADPELETFLRSKYHLPDRDETDPPRPAEPAPAATSPAAARRRGQVPTRAAATNQLDPSTLATVSLRRQPTNLEVAAKTDFARVQNRWTDALEKLIEDWDSIGADHRDQLVEQVAAAVEAGDVTALAELSVDTDDAGAALDAVMREVAADAAQQQADEAEAQGVTVGAGEPDEVRLNQIALTIAALIGSGLAGSAARKALQAWTPDATAAEVSAAVREHLESLTDAALRDNLGSGLSTAQNEGRIVTLRAAPAADQYAASEILDANSCQPCRDVDGHIFDSLDDAETSYANGGYSGCQGGLRCRGIIVTLWDESALEEAA